MQHILLSMAAFLAFSGVVVGQDAPSRQEDPVVYLMAMNWGVARDFSEPDWRVAIAGTAQRVAWKIDSDRDMPDRMLEVAASAANGPAFAVLGTENLTQGAFAELQTAVDGGATLDGFEFEFRMPGCMMLRSAADPVPTHTIITLDTSVERQACYAAAIAYIIENSGQFISPPVDTVQIDPTAATAQAAMPQLSLQAATFIIPDDWTERRQVVARPDNTFASGEMIMLHALLDNVGRSMPGTPLGSYEIRLDIVVRDADGAVLIDDPDVMRFNGPAIHDVPVRDDYFETGVVTGFPLTDPGRYQIAYRLTDLNRDPEKTETLEILMDVVVEE